MGVTLSSRGRGGGGVSLVEWPLDAADLVEKSEAERRKLRRASNQSPRSLMAAASVVWQRQAQTSAATPVSGRARVSGARVSPDRARAAASEAAKAALTPSRSGRYFQGGVGGQP